jgi:hypothetical protein
MYDAAGLRTLGFPNANNITLNNATILQRIQQYHTQYLGIVKTAVLSAPINGGFLTACNQHEEICRSEDYEGIHIKVCVVLCVCVCLCISYSTPPYNHGTRAALGNRDGWGTVTVVEVFGWCAKGRRWWWF